MATKAPSKRACDQCNYRRVRCSGGQPCEKCSNSHLNCTFEKAAKGRTGKRIHALKENADTHSTNIQPPPVPNWPSAGPSTNTPSSQSDPSPRNLNSLGLHPQHTMPIFPADNLNSGPHSHPHHLSASGPMSSPEMHTPQLSMSMPALLPSLNSSFSDTFFGGPVNTPWQPTDFSASPSTLNANFNAFPFAWPLELTADTWTNWLSDIGHQPASEPSNASADLPNASTPLSPGNGPSVEASTTPISDSQYPVSAPQPPVDDMLQLDEEPLSDSNLIPLIGIFFERMHPIMPVFTRAWLLSRIDADEHKTLPQFGAMLLALSALALIQPLKSAERVLRKARLQRARMLLDTAAKTGCNTMLGQDPSLDAVLTSFYMFACLFGLQEHGAASFRLREAVTLAKLMGLHIPSSYQALPSDERERRLRAFWLLCITERAYALQGGDSIGFAGLPYETMADLIRTLHTNKLEDFPLHQLRLFNAVDSRFVECWNNKCEGRACTQFNAQRALQLHAALDSEESALSPGEPPAVPQQQQSNAPQVVRKTTAWERADIQHTDTVITRQWLHIRVWQTCLSHGLLSNESVAFQLRFSYVLDAAHQALQTYQAAASTARDAHGIGLVGKLRDIALVLAVSVGNLPSSSFPAAESVLDQYDLVLRSSPEDAQNFAHQLEAARKRSQPTQASL